MKNYQKFSNDAIDLADIIIDLNKIKYNKQVISALKKIIYMLINIGAKNKTPYKSIRKQIPKPTTIIKSKKYKRLEKIRKKEENDERN